MKIKTQYLGDDGIISKEFDYLFPPRVGDTVVIDGAENIVGEVKHDLDEGTLEIRLDPVMLDIR